MFDRPIIYSLAQDRSYDHLWAFREALFGDGQLVNDLLGSTSTAVAGLAATPTGPASLTVNIAAGDIYSQAEVDATAYGSITGDTTLTMMAGRAKPQTALFSTGGLSSGQSRWALLSAAFSQTDEIPGDDPTAGLLNYLNSDDPSGPPWTGPNNDNTPQNTRRQGICTLAITYGTVATTGSEAPPSAPGSAVGLYLVDLAFGQSTITADNILVAGPSAGSNVPANYPAAPFLAGLAGRPVVGSYAGNPNGNVPGTAWPSPGTPNAPNQIIDTTNDLVWQCFGSGAASTAAWLSTGAQALAATQVGAFVNKYRNATFSIWQRGTSITVSPGSPVMTADGWLVGCSGASVTVAQAGSIGQGPNSLQITGQSGVTDVFVVHVIESITAQALAGRNCVNQIKLLNNSGASITPTATYKHAGTTDTWSSSTTDRTQILQTVANSANGILSDFPTLPSGWTQGGSVRFDFGGALNGAGKNIQLGDADIRVGTTNTVPLPEIRNITAEMLECQRYLPSILSNITHAWVSAGGVWGTSTAAGVSVQFYTPARVAVTGVIVSAASDFSLNDAGAFRTCTSVGFNNSSTTAGSLNASVASSGASAGYATNLLANAITARLNFTGAEITGSAI